ncbi:phospholipid methyltransferase family protein [Cavenderia fasciculata]|uniref:Phosphatidylethanolamine N-methyltransferase n=1 Tax=Cavenderia fasciculata TaxID=261658 RepID=F4PNV6_CACFS|nr:phospholipid methyltransferase family protein [Cavenderia fasciculata]EGG23159.1 phospholipid methyltransferase family protein [Cavenderia fasciculata]|eukprot:XP_004361010.1 phospholipid methyltransferase family protein [Cavenderia fasciculata]
MNHPLFDFQIQSSIYLFFLFMVLNLSREMDILTSHIDLSDNYFWYAIAAIAGTPTWWNIVARLEYKTRFLTKLAGGKYAACYVLAFLIFTCSLLRDYLFSQSIKNQPTYLGFDNNVVLYSAYLLYVIGGVLVGSTYWRLGITGTYLGDYCGILMKERITGFPFNTMANPMYNGASILFLAHALVEKSVAGVVLTAVVYIVYRIAILFEEPFTGQIYAQRDAKQGLKKKMNKIN